MSTIDEGASITAQNSVSDNDTWKIKQDQTNIAER